ncbi:CPBP family intramembrane metalloprotease [Deinococcus sp. Arct2-2]|uniref:CPBP family intramembrane glutamic endopeptidase n=1 Tax=Deinococcus sp. Arct2-2 TaxID=2568653 RepID=UPI0010A2C9EF|nr:type II CAAX endopeptidase family protein [Deinococcus sp. Arct2-2]THF67809.1 CPBP family intramembrane metalloprotease [Deinococcus sp. Arct2-2]
MTAPDAPSTPPQAPPESPAPLWPTDQTPVRPPTDSGIRAVDGNRAALTLLLTQNVVSAVLMSQGVPLGTALLLSFVANLILALTIFRPSMRALVQDSRWRTPPSWGLAIAAFVLAFLASRAFALFFVVLFPSGAGAIPQFLTQGPDLWALLLAAGLLIPLAEEVAFRGLMMRGHERAAGFTVAAITVSVAFAVAHGVPASIAGILPLAYALARLAQHTGSLWNGVIVHVLNNSIAIGLGAFLAGRNLPDPTESGDLLRNSALTVPLALGALLFGGVVMVVLHLWLVPKPDPAVKSRPGPWLSAAYVAVLLFGVLAALLTLPAVAQALADLQTTIRALPSSRP